MKAWWCDSLDHVFPRTQPPAAARPMVAQAARNEIVALQCVLLSDRDRQGVMLAPEPLRAKGAELPAPRWRAVGYVPVKQNTRETPPEELAGPAPGPFPDPLLELGSVSLAPGKAQPIWLTLHVPADAAPGRYEGRITVSDEPDRVELEYAVEVAAATLPETRTLRIHNWFWADERIMRQLGVEGQYSEAWWRMVKGFLVNLWAHRQNTCWLREYGWAVTYSVRAGQLVMDFSRFDRWVEMLRRLGGDFWIEGPFLTVRDGYDGTFEVPVPIVAGNRVEVRRLGCDDPRVESFLRQFLREYQQRVRHHGLEGRVLVHVGDEPHDGQMQDYARLATLVHRHAPGLRIIEALDVSHDYEFFDAHTDLWVPLLGRYDAHLDVIQQRRAAGKDVWHYTCLFPRGRHPNRFVDYPLVKTRILHWMNFRWDLGGYLHWGWNAWFGDPFQDLEPEWGNGATLPPGDAFIVYPGNDGVLDSVRYEQMLEGIQDYELLRLLAAQRPEEAQQLASEAVPGFTDYVREPARFRDLRQRLLAALSR